MKDPHSNTCSPFLHLRTFTRVILISGALAASCLHPGSSALAQANPPGKIDATFNQGAGADGFVRVVAVQPDGKILLGGNFATARGMNNRLITRLKADGTADSGFTSPFPSPVLASRIYTVGVQEDGRIIVGGLFTSVGGAFRTNIARLQTNGLLDPSFNSNGGPSGPSGLVRIMALQPDGRIIIAGEFTTVDQTNRNRIARLNADGSLDLSFDPGTGANDTVRSVALLPGGQVLVGGLFTSFNGHPLKYLVRLNRDGTLDTSFPAGGGPNSSLYFVSPQADSSVWIAGDFSAVNGTNINRIARLHADGSLDNSFMPSGGAVGGPVYHIVHQENGKIVIGGDFTAVNSVSLSRLARLKPDGSLDPSFDPGTGANGTVLSLAIQRDGNLLLGGLFTSYDGSNVGMFARVYGDPVTPVLAALLSDSTHVLVSWPASASGYTLQAASNLLLRDWQGVTNTPTLDGSRLSVTLPLAVPAQFYRLISQ